MASFYKNFNVIKTKKTLVNKNMGGVQIFFCVKPKFQQKYNFKENKTSRRMQKTNSSWVQFLWNAWTNLLFCFVAKLKFVTKITSENKR